MYKNISLAKEAKPYLTELIENAEKLNVKVQEINNATVIDCGINTPGSIEAGLLFVKISLGGLAKARINFFEELIDDRKTRVFPEIHIETSQPVLATLGCQAASWNINKEGFVGMACGPGRALAKKPSKIYDLINYEDKDDLGILCIEANSLPNPKAVDYLARKCEVEKKNLRLLLVRTGCLVEYIQMAARSVELGVFKLVEQLGYPPENVLHAMGTGIIPPMIADDTVSNNRINNGLIYGTKLLLIVRSQPKDNLEELVHKISSQASPSYGKTFAELFEEAGNDFSNFDLTILAPSKIIINDIRTGNTYQQGEINTTLLSK
ncbi:MAG: methenyltetrahydromethanopterin cyclohydrolase [Candidatus Heimdallarchaeota archaeon]|nr:methenyltetrahydromethanopterin cyclohydrolase [Candidatus Heimdallarchaeota archaeon]